MYREKLDEIMYTVNNKAISTKILQRMDEMRNNNNEGQARRFVWELVQNAKDVAQEEVPLKIRMTLEHDKFVFAHNGKSFLLKNLLSLINQVSGKKEGDGSTGKFGTGFITTHLLSESVKVRGVLEDFGYDPKRFEVLLDRSGRTDEEIIGAVYKAMESVRQVDDNSAADFRREDLNTEFEYALESDYSRNVALTGMNDASCNLFYCMAFVPNVYQIEFVDNTKGTNVAYTRGKLEKINDNISELIILENSTEHKIIISSDGSVQTAAEVDGDWNALPLSEKTSRLFCDFPLIDNVLFPFPTVVNSSKFRANEPRSFITLTDNPNSTDSEINKRLMKQAVALYDVLLKYLESKGCKALYNVIKTPPVFKRSDISDAWVNSNIISGIAQHIAQRKILLGKNGLFSAWSVTLKLPLAERKELNSQLNALLSGYSSCSIITEDIDSWCDALYSLNNERFAFVSIKDVLTLVSEKGSKNNLSRIISGDIISWLGELYKCAAEVDSLKNEIYAGKYKIFPTQAGVFASITEVYVEQTEIDEYFKGICDTIDGYVDSHYVLKLRTKLLDREYDATGIENLREFSVSEVSSHISRGTKYEYVGIRSDARAVIKKMAACCSDERLYRTYRYFIRDIPERYSPTLKLREDVWTNSNYYLTTVSRDILTELAKRSDGFSSFKNTCGGEDEAIDAINCLHELWEKYCQPSNSSLPVLVEQIDGTVALKNMMPRSTDFVTNGGIDDRLREIYRRIVTDGAAIIDKRIIVGSSMGIRSMDEFGATSLVGNKVTAELKEGALFNKPKDFQAACSLLMRWINSNEDKAKRLFPAYASKEDRMQLMTPGQAAEMSEELDKVYGLMKNAGCGDLEELARKLGVGNKEEAEQKQITEEYSPFGYDPLADNLEDVFKKIGDKGEELAVEYLKKQYGESAEVTLCNTENEKQQGFDIVVKTNGRVLFYEVKTHTETSRVRNQLSFSRTQAMMLGRTDYRVLLVIIDRQWRLAEAVEFDDVLSGFTAGYFVRNDGYEIIAK